MKTIYLDSDFKCHITNSGNMLSIETDFFDGKCDDYIEGHIFVPVGYPWTRSDGKIFYNGMIKKWQNYYELEKKQQNYETDLLKSELDQAQIKISEYIIQQEELNASYIEGVNSI